MDPVGAHASRIFNINCSHKLHKLNNDEADRIYRGEVRLASIHGIAFVLYGCYYSTSTCSVQLATTTCHGLLSALMHPESNMSSATWSTDLKTG